MVELQPSKLVTWVRFPSPAPYKHFAGVAELADARDLKSRGWKQPYRFDSGPRHHQAILSYAAMAKLADALASGASDGNIMEVQVLLAAPVEYMRLWRNWQTRYFEGVVPTRHMGSSPINRTIEIQPSVLEGFFVRNFM